MPTTIELSQESRILRTWLRSLIDEGRDAFTYAEAAAKLSVDAKDHGFRTRLRNAVGWAERELGVVFACERGSGYRRAEAKQAGDLLASRRKRATRQLKRGLRSAETLSRGGELSEADQNRLFIESSAASAALSAMSDQSRKTIEGRVRAQSQELPTADVFRALSEASS